MGDQLQDIIRTLDEPGNPIYIAIYIIVTIFALIFIFIKYVILPLRKKHLLEKQEIELRNTRLMALFSELNPDPMLRLDTGGKIVNANEAGVSLTGMVENEEKNIFEIIPGLDLDIRECIKENMIITQNHTINDKYYSVLFRGISVLGFVQVYLHDLTDRKTFEEQLKESRKKLKELSGHLQEKLEEQRLRLTRELHDSIGQNLYLVRMNIQKWEDLFKESGKDEEYSKLMASTEDTISELKNILMDLKPKMLDEAGLGPSLHSLCERVHSEQNIKGSVNITGLDERLDSKLETALYRIAQEALNNVVKHSKATECNLQLFRKEGKVRMIISDDGIGFDINSKEKEFSNEKSYGLMNISERVESFNGKFKIDSTPEKGTVLFIEIPLELN